MGLGSSFYLTVWLAVTGFALPCAAQNIGSPSPQDILEHNLNSLRGPSPGAPMRVGPPTPQQSLDYNLNSQRSSGPIRNVPTPQYYPPATARSPDRHPGADDLLSGTGTSLMPTYDGRRRKTHKRRR